MSQDPNKLPACFDELTDQQKLQARLTQADRMTSVGMLIAGVAHEINNPLACVLYNLETTAKDVSRVVHTMNRCWSALVAYLGTEKALEVVGEGSEVYLQDAPQDLQERLDESLEAARRVRDLVQNLKLFSQRGEDRPNLVWVNLVIERAFQLVFCEIKYKAQLVKEYQDDKPILAHEAQVLQVFVNLLMNAAQSIEEGRVQQNKIGVRTWIEGDEVVAEVWDTGGGITPENKERIFDPFFTTKTGVGCGLGLSICRDIIFSVGGKIEVQSTVSRGSRFTVRLPIAKSAANRLPALEDGDDEDAARNQVKERGRILVVDDQPSVGKVLQRMLGREHDLIIVQSGGEAKRILESDTAFHLVLCDLMMPDVSGMDLFEWLDAAHPELAQRMVFISGGTFTPRAAEFVQKIGDRLLEKPFSVRKVKSMLEKMVRNGH